MTEQEDNALIQYSDWLSEKYILLPRRFISRDAIRVGYRQLQLYLYISDEILNGRCLMDDNGDAYLIISASDFADMFDMGTTENVSSALRLLREKRMIETERPSDELMGLGDGLRMYLLDPDTKERIKVLK